MNRFWGIFVLHSMCTGTISCYETPIHSTLLNYFNRHLNDYVVYFYGVDLYPLDFQFEAFNQTIQTVTGSNNSNIIELSVKRHSVRHTAIMLMAFSYCSDESMVPGQLYEAMEVLLLSPDTLTLLVDFNDKCPTQNIQNNIRNVEYLESTVAIKILVSHDSSCNLRSFVMCGSSCNYDFKIFPFDSFIGRNDARDIHKAKFRLANNVVISAYINGAPNELYRKRKRKSFLCDRIYKMRKYQWLHFKNAKYCWAKPMLAAEISKIHNVSYNEYHTNRGYNEYSYILQDEQGEIMKTNLNGIYLQYYSGWSWFYCKYSKGERPGSWIDYHMWVEPMSTSFCSFLILCWTSSACLISHLHGKNYFENFTSNFAFLLAEYHESNRIPDWMIKMQVVCVIGLSYIWNLYIEEITSLVAVKEKMEPFETLTNFNKEGFRVASINFCGSNETYAYKFHCEDTTGLTYGDKVNMKLGIEWPARWGDWYFPKFSKQYKKKLPVECFQVVEEFKREPWYLLINTVSRHWMLETVERVHEAGLMEWWNEMAQYATENHNRNTFIDYEKGAISPDAIDFRRVLAVMTIYGAILFVSIIVCIVEGFNSIAIFISKWVRFSLSIALSNCVKCCCKLCNSLKKKSEATIFVNVKSRAIVSRNFSQRKKSYVTNY